MSQKNVKKLHTIYGWSLGVLTIVVGVLFAVQSCRILATGSFSADKVARFFVPISPVVYVWLVAVIVGGILWQVFPLEKQKVKVHFDADEQVKRLKKWLPAQEPPDEGVAERRALHSYDVKADICLWILVAYGLATIVYAGFYLGDLRHFPAENMLAEAEQMALHVVVPFAVFFLLCCLNSVIRLYIGKKQLPIVKQLVKKHAVRPLNKVETSHKLLWSVRGVLAVVGVTSVVLGIVNGGMAEVLQKAINICTECIGLG